MQDEKQFEQLMLQYTQLKNGAEDIARMIDNEDFDTAITRIKAREELYLSCKCMRKYLELTPVQQKELDTMLDELRELELANIKKLEKGMEDIQKELKLTKKTKRIHQADNVSEGSKGSIVNLEE